MSGLASACACIPALLLCLAKFFALGHLAARSLPADHLAPALLSHVGYNSASYAFLAASCPVLHSVANILKRLVVIASMFAMDGRAPSAMAVGGLGMVAVGLVLTYQATGVLNFAYGAQAYLSAFVFTYLVQNEHLPVGLAFVIAVVVLAPAVGLVFDRFLFRKIAPANVIAKLVTGISMLIGIPAVLSILFTNSNQYNSPSILFNPDVVYFRIAGTPINGISVTCVLATAVTLVALVVLLRWTSLGLKMRGAVESRRLIELDGVNGGRVVASAWAVSGFIATRMSIPCFTASSSPKSCRCSSVVAAPMTAATPR